MEISWGPHMKSPIDPRLPTATEDAKDPDATSSSVMTKEFAGSTIARIFCCSGDNSHPAHIGVVLTDGRVVEIINDGDSFLVGTYLEAAVNLRMPSAPGVH